MILYGETYYKTLSRNIHPDLRSKVDLLVNLIRHKSFGSYLKEKFSDNEIKNDDIKNALTECKSMEDVIHFLKRQCSICLGDFPFPKMCQMYSCRCEFCPECLKSWLREMIMSKPTNDWFCPVCPKSKMKTVDRNVHFLAFQSIINRDSQLKNLFHDRLRDENLRENSNFHWCKNEKCLNGFEIVNNLDPKVTCPTCLSIMCTNCEVQWHESETCEQYQMRKLREDSDLSKLLQKIGIECPKCRMQFDLARGGCLHFQCTKCGVDFCGCCKELFMMKECNRPHCRLAGLHAHHPKNCAYYTRDYSIDTLESILKPSKFIRPNESTTKWCPVIISNKNLKDKKCSGKSYRNAGLCKEHYQEYLCLLIYKYGDNL